MLPLQAESLGGPHTPKIMIVLYIQADRAWRASQKFSILQSHVGRMIRLHPRGRHCYQLEKPEVKKLKDWKKGQLWSSLCTKDHGSNGMMDVSTDVSNGQMTLKTRCLLIPEESNTATPLNLDAPQEKGGNAQWTEIKFLHISTIGEMGF